MEQSCRWSRARLIEHQRASVDALRRFAYAQSPFYARFHRGLESAPLERLPVLTKRVLMENFDDLVTDRAVRLADAEAYLASGREDGLFRDRYVVLATSGSTGFRGLFLFDPDEWVTALALITRPVKWAGVKPNPLRPARAAMITSMTNSHYSAQVGSALQSWLVPTIRMDAADPMPEIVAKLNAWQPEMVGAYPSVWRELAAEQIAGRLRISLKHAHSSAEALTPDVRRQAERAWGIKIYNVYGATEYAPIAAECQFGNMHLLEDGALIEIADERGPVAMGVTGDRVLITVFDRRTQPLIRYEISDMVKSIAGQCECGRPFQLIDAIEGRQEDVLSFDSRAGEAISVHPNDFHRVLETVPAAGWQVIQDEDALRVLLVGLGDAGLCESIGGSICSLLESKGIAAPPVDVRPVSELRRGSTGKAPLVLANRARGAKS